MQSKVVTSSSFLRSGLVPGNGTAEAPGGGACNQIRGKSQRACSGFSLVDLVVVLVIVGLLAGMVLPSIQGERGRSHVQTHCMSNQRQIVLAMMIYQSDNDELWPVFTAARDGSWVSSHDPRLDAASTAIASFEFLAGTMNGDLSVKIFECPQRTQVRPLTNAVALEGRSAISAWAQQGITYAGFSYDWSAPKKSLGMRVIIADRDVTAHNGNQVMASFADGHVGAIRREGKEFINKGAGNDDIYTSWGDGPMTTPGAGSATRAYVR